MTAIGYAYTAGTVVAMDVPQAVEWFRKGAASGDAFAYFSDDEWATDRTAVDLGGLERYLAERPP